MSSELTRTCRIEQTETPGRVAGILATEGEASDGHIIDVGGLRATEGAPLLFGHDDFTGRSNLGAWTGFQKEGDQAGARLLRGEAQIELDGFGDQAEWRKDVNLLVSKGSIRSFSIRWEPEGEVTRRSQLDPDHFAFVDAEATSHGDAKRHGLFFGSSRMVEGSIVTIGADQSAVIGRSMETSGDLQRFWVGVVRDMIPGQELDLVDAPTGGKVRIRGREQGQDAEIDTWVWEKFVKQALDEHRAANAALRSAYDLVMEGLRVYTEQGEPNPHNAEERRDPTGKREPEASEPLSEIVSKSLAGFREEIKADTVKALSRALG